LKDNGKPKRFWLPKGIIIPLCRGKQVLRVRIRRPENEPRYFILRGSSTRAMILGGLDTTILVESELDAMLLYQEAGELANLIALGNAQARPDREAADLLKKKSVDLGEPGC
jgi:DNA primase